MEPLLGKSLDELQTIAIEAGLPRFVGKQLCEWIYRKRVSSFDEMSNISIRARQALQAKYTIGRSLPTAEAVSQDGTRKYLFETIGNDKPNYIECVYLPEDDRVTLCVSTQAGCKMGCRFCMTGTLGFHGNLSAADILAQVLHFPDLTNLVLMGEGEPMDNIDNVLRALNVLTADWGLAWSPKRITVSTVGVLNIKQFLEESDCHLAISLHNAFSEERAAIMPAERLTPIKDILDIVRQYDWSHQRRLSFEYICWAGVNDDLRHTKQLLRLVSGLPCRVNLIRFHSTGDNPLFPASDEQRMIVFRDYLSARGVTCTIRRSRGEDILAACGMLVNALQK
ncbi:MAG: 23S rRNA (adenine(2503)-C(2))-methyltransferase RlmN [Paludibacteraceae bacterium]|nr:23S rRNA (adenine(2503)-C(2))-methyltransferase RlmN [Paludibacteraceae bacterium]